ncbi:MAG: hypothetical protein DHS80DRAFT_14911 [Piptocephalis tieghemiana]|nr:MAG: hypothetical protein DHS80DRAFT_14911 [Piptocephalis tieghemiana]
MSTAKPTVHLLDYGAGNVRSVINALKHLGVEVIMINTPEDLATADRVIFPGVGSFGPAMEALGPYVPALKEYLGTGKPFMGICVGLQSLFEGSEEAPGVAGIGYFPGCSIEFDRKGKSVPHMGWNTLRVHPSIGPLTGLTEDRHYYFVHSYAVPLTEVTRPYALATCWYGEEEFVAAARKGNVFATQFHPEKSGPVGLAVLESFLRATAPSAASASAIQEDSLTKRIIACLDVRGDDQGKLVVTKGQGYDVREGGVVRDLGDPVEMAQRYYAEGADEVCFLNITSFRNSPLEDQPMLDCLRKASTSIFVPLTIGGGIRDTVDPDGKTRPALEVAGAYFRSGADKVSIGSDAVYAAEEYWAAGGKGTGKSSIEQISRRYGAQAVVVSVDPKRIWVQSPELTHHHCVRARKLGPEGEAWCWYQCTVKGGREGRDLDVQQLVRAVEALGAGELLVNCMDEDGAGKGFDHALLSDVKESTSLPVVASSGAGCADHFPQVFGACNVEAALAAGIFHRREVSVSEVKVAVTEAGIMARILPASSA